MLAAKIILAFVARALLVLGRRGEIAKVRFTARGTGLLALPVLDTKSPLVIIAGVLRCVIVVCGQIFVERTRMVWWNEVKRWTNGGRRRD